MEKIGGRVPGNHIQVFPSTYQIIARFLVNCIIVSSPVAVKVSSPFSLC